MLVVTSTRLAVRVVEKSCAHSTRVLTQAPVRTALRSEANVRPAGAVIIQTRPHPAKRTRFRAASTTSLADSEGRSMRPSAASASAPLTSTCSEESVARSRTTR